MLNKIIQLWNSLWNAENLGIGIYGEPLWTEDSCKGAENCKHPEQCQADGVCTDLLVDHSKFELDGCTVVLEAFKHCPESRVNHEQIEAVLAEAHGFKKIGDCWHTIEELNNFKEQLDHVHKAGITQEETGPVEEDDIVTEPLKDTLLDATLKRTEQMKRARQKDTKLTSKDLINKLVDTIDSKARKAVLATPIDTKPLKVPKRKVKAPKKAGKVPKKAIKKAVKSVTMKRKDK